jgi:hypothetical protein
MTIPVFGDLTLRFGVNGLRRFGGTYGFICKGQETSRVGAHLEDERTVFLRNGSIYTTTQPLNQ